MGQEDSLIRKGLRASKAAAIAGILFCVLLITSQLLVWISIPANLEGPAINVISHSKTIELALNLLPFAGIAFLWFIAAVHNRLGAQGRPLLCPGVFGERAALYCDDLHIGCT